MNTVETTFIDPACFARIGNASITSEAARFVRISLDAFIDDEHPCFQWHGEHLRWYHRDDTPRSRPLDMDELIAELKAVFGFDEREAEWLAVFESRARPGDIEVWERLQGAVALHQAH